MTSSETLAGGLPASMQSGLERFCERLQKALGDHLVSAVLYGWAAEEEYSQGSPDVNVMVVVDNASVETLDQMGKPVRKALNEFRLALLVLSEDDVRRSTDVFPIKFLGMQRRHRILCGKDVLADLQISREHLRLRCEQEIKNLMIRLHQLYLQRKDSPKRTREVLYRAIPSFLNGLGVLVELKVGAAPTTNDATVEKAAELGVDVEPLRIGLALKRGQTKLTSGELKELYATFMKMVRQAADIVDQM
jgi:hypothetical protein